MSDFRQDLPFLDEETPARQTTGDRARQRELFRRFPEQGGRCVDAIHEAGTSKAAKGPNVRHEAAKRFVAWMLSREGQNAIGGFRWKGEPLFFPNAAHSRAWRGRPGGEEAGPEG